MAEPELLVPVAPPQDPPPPPQFQIPTPVLIVLLGVCGFASTYAMRMVDPLVPSLAHDLGRTVNEVAVLASAYALAYAAGQPVLGALGDTFGKARTISMCCFLSGTGSLACALAVSFDLLLVARFLAGIVAGGIIPLSMAAIGDRVPLAERQTALSRFMVTTLIGQMSGIAVSGVVADLTGWRSVFVVAAVIAFSAGTLVRLRLKPRPNAQRRSFSLAGSVNGYRGVLANPRAVPLYAIVFIEGGLIQGLNPYAAAILAERAGTRATEAGLVIGAGGLGAFTYAVFAPWLVRNLRPRAMTQLGGAIVGLGVALFGVALIPWYVAPAFFFLIGFGFFLLHNNLQTQATELSQTHRGSAVALFAASFFIGQAGGPLLYGIAIPLLGTTWALAMFALALLGLGFLAARALRL
jgi:YNFM family putative membrane transporter